MSTDPIRSGSMIEITICFCNYRFLVSLLVACLQSTGTVHQTDSCLVASGFHTHIFIYIYIYMGRNRLTMLSLTILTIGFFKIMKKSLKILKNEKKFMDLLFNI